MFNIDKNNIPKTHLAEADQKNPLRWQCIHRVDENKYVADTPVFRCKDYFNDFVIYNQLGKRFTAYGMDSSWAKVDEFGGMYVYLINLTQGFTTNIERVLNPSLLENYGFLLEFEPGEKKDGILYLPKLALQNTYRISLITLFIRCANTKALNSWEEFISSDNFKYEKYKLSHYDTRFKGIINNQYALDIEEDYVWYAGEKYNNKVEFGYLSDNTLHYNGFYNWLSFIHPRDGV